jgi:uncharacterized protein
MYRFLLTASILVLLGFIYLGHRLIADAWSFPIRLTMWIALGGMIVNLLWLPFKRWQLTGKSKSRPLRHNGIIRFFEASAYNLMGFLSLLLLFTALSEFARIALKFLPQSFTLTIYTAIPAGSTLDATLAIAILGCSTLFFIWGRTKVAIGPRYKFVNVIYPLEGNKPRRPRFRKRHRALRKVRIVQVSDLHIGRAIKKPYVEKVVRMINAQNADLACFTGDIGDGAVTNLLADAAPLKDITTKHGTYYIPGNHEYYWGMQNWLAAFTALNFKSVINRGEIVNTDAATLFVAGTSDPTAARFAEALPQIPNREKSDLAILLAHQPIFAKSAVEKQYDLMLSGHTHGGQYIPWSWVVHLIYRFASGLYRTASMLVYVNDGTGYWGAPVRIGTRLEITVLDIYFKAE